MNFYYIDQHYACALINDDYSALEDDEVITLDEWKADKGYITIVDEPVDFRRCDICGLFGDCLQVVTNL